MTTTRMQPLADPAELAEQLDASDIRIIDLSPGEVFAEHHAPGAVHLPYGEITANRPPVGGLVPPQADLVACFSRLGIGPETRVYAMDAEGGGAAGRLFWTLELLGHTNVALVDGGLRAWVEEGFPIERGAGNAAPAAVFTAQARPDRQADAGYILDGLGRGDLCLLDARSADEYSGRKVRAARGGHIPGALHFEWTRGMDRERSLRLREPAQLREDLDALGITPEREIVTYCHTHHRSAFTYAMLRILGYEQVRGYPGSWSDWGNREDTPIEVG
jgi:thiosulfate/3-mercaptopyruvate sulfurtransferase